RSPSRAAASCWRVSTRRALRALAKETRRCRCSTSSGRLARTSGSTARMTSGGVQAGRRRRGVRRGAAAGAGAGAPEGQAGAVGGGEAEGVGVVGRELIVDEVPGDVEVGLDDDLEGVGLGLVLAEGLEPLVGGDGSGGLFGVGGEDGLVQGVAGQREG